MERLLEYVVIFLPCAPDCTLFSQSLKSTTMKQQTLVYFFTTIALASCQPENLSFPDDLHPDQLHFRNHDEENLFPIDSSSMTGKAATIATIFNHAAAIIPEADSLSVSVVAKITFSNSTIGITGTIDTIESTSIKDYPESLALNHEDIATIIRAIDYGIARGEEVGIILGMGVFFSKVSWGAVIL